MNTVLVTLTVSLAKDTCPVPSEHSMLVPFKSTGTDSMVALLTNLLLTSAAVILKLSSRNGLPVLVILRIVPVSPFQTTVSILSLAVQVSTSLPPGHTGAEEGGTTCTNDAIQFNSS